MTPAEMRSNYPAARQFEPDIYAELERQGLVIVCVVFEGKEGVHASKHRSSHVTTDILEFLPEGSGFHSTFDLPEQRWWFYHLPRKSLAGGIAGLKEGLQAKGLLRPAKILTAESASELLQWHPATAEKITA